ncbi:MAG: tetratricopeptide repeat protein, partial [Pseudomonadota bacterium]
MALAAVFVSACGDRRSPDQRVADARSSIEISRFRDAIIEMRSLLRERPDYVDARLTLGQALMSVGDMAAAEKELERARQMSASPDDYLEALVRTWQSRGNHHEVLADALPELVSDPGTAHVIEALRGRSMLALDSEARAAELFSRVLSADSPPEAQRIALIGEAEIAGRHGDSDTSVARLKEALALAPDTPESILALGRTYLNRGEFDNTIELLVSTRDSTMQARRKDWFHIEGQLAEAYLGKGDLINAREATETLLKIGKTHPMSSYLHGRVELDSGNVNEAIQYFQQVLADYPGYAPALTLMGVALIELDDMDQAEMNLSEAVAQDPANVKVRRLLAETRMRMGRSRAAIATLQAGLRNDSADASMITLLGRESLRIGKRDDGLRYLREALAEDPDNLRANLALAQAYLADGETDAAVAVLNALSDRVIDVERRALLVRIARIDRSDPDTAAGQIDELLQDAPNDPFMLGLAGGFYLTVGQLDRARELFDGVLVQMPDNRSAMLSHLEIDERAGDFTRSRALFTAANEMAPDDLLPLLVLARIESATGNEAAAIALVEEALEKHPTALLPNLILAAQAMREDQLERAEVLA